MDNSRIPATRAGVRCTCWHQSKYSSATDGDNNIGQYVATQYINASIPNRHFYMH